MRRVIAIALAAAACCWCGEIDPRGIFISSTASTGPGAAAPPALKLRVELSENGRFVPVPNTYRFRSGDRFRFFFELSQASHVYVVNRSIEGNPEAMRDLLGTRGINVVNQASGAAQERPTFHVLWPPAGADTPLAARQTQSIPGQTQFFEFDANPGIEKISVLVSPYQIDIAKYFGGLPSTGHDGATGHRNDTNAEVLAQLEDLKSLDGNTATDPGASRGICVGDCSQYAAPRVQGRPFIVTVDLLHSR